MCSIHRNQELKYFSTILVVVFLTTAANAQQTEPKQAELLVRHIEDFEISGDGSASPWEKAQWIPITKRNGNSKYETKAKLLYSDKGVYAFFTCTDSKITSTMKEDFSDLWKEDVVEIFFWPEESTRLYFEYELSPMNYELSILCPNFNGEQYGWRPWHYEGARKTNHKTKIRKDTNCQVTGWSGELFIPFALLKPLRNVPAKSGTKWRTNMYRIDYDEAETYWTWQPVQSDFHDIERYGTLVFE
ncbi:MAG: carbohydrate-binding family 9-like protein [Chryseolinea sp.]